MASLHQVVGARRREAVLGRHVDAYGVGGWRSWGDERGARGNRRGDAEERGKPMVVARRRVWPAADAAAVKAAVEAAEVRRRHAVVVERRRRSDVAAAVVVVVVRDVLAHGHGATPEVVVGRRLRARLCNEAAVNDDGGRKRSFVN